MGNLLRQINTFFAELRRRNVYRVAGTYLVVSFFALQVVDLLIPATKLPSWINGLLLAILIVGFPIVLFITWAFEVSPEGIRRTPSADSEPVPEERKETFPNAMYLTIGLAILGILMAGYWYWPADKVQKPVIQKKSIAVLPFQVSGSGADTWRDGMVTMLSTGLDGAAELRAIADRTIFAALQKLGSEQKAINSNKAIEIARNLGASYAVVGSAVKLSDKIRFVAEVHATTSDQKLGQARVEGASDNVPQLADRLTRRLLEILLEKSGQSIPSINLPELTTSSLPALKAFLKGEQLYRSGDYKQSIENYKTAIRQDSSFALPYIRLYDVKGWVESDYGEKYLEKAYQLIDRLPRREHRVIRALYLRNQGYFGKAADSLRHLTREYPDDPWVWYRYGEICRHLHISHRYSEMDQAFKKAISLDPGAASYYIHYVELAMSYHHDSLMTARRLATDPNAIHYSKKYHQTASKLIFGRPSQQEKIIASLDTMTIDNNPPHFEYLFRYTMLSPTDLDLAEQVIQQILNIDGITDKYRNTQQTRMIFLAYPQGRLRDSYRRIKEYDAPVFRKCISAYSMSLGYASMEKFVMKDSLKLDPMVSDISKDRIYELFCRGIQRIEQNPNANLSNLTAHLRDILKKQENRKGYLHGIINELKGYQAWKQGDHEEAAGLWENASYSYDVGAIWRGELYRQMGKLEKAEGWYRAAWSHPVAHERLGLLYEQMNKPQKAAAAYRRFLEAWKDADPEQKPLVEQTRKRLEKLIKSENMVKRKVL